MDLAPTDQKCGYIALLGRPNAGKSTLLNALVGQKIAGVSKRPQTTRNRILGVDTFGNSQCIYLDTPGVHRGGKKLINQNMNKAAWAVLEEADVVCYLIDSKKGIEEEDEVNLKQLIKRANVPVMVLASKIDSVKKDVIKENCKAMHSVLSSICDEFDKDQILPLRISAKRKETLGMLREKFENLIPTGPWNFDEDDLTDRSQNFIVTEMVREQAFRQLGEEIPYGLTVTIESFRETAQIVNIQAAIIVERQNHKPIVIGRRGSRVKQIGMDSRAALERHFDKKVFIELFVKVQENWTDKVELIQEFQGVLDN